MRPRRPAGRAPATRRPVAPTPLAADGEDADEEEELAVGDAPRPADDPVRVGLGFADRHARVGIRSAARPLVDEEDFEEPEIPEYLIAEQRRGGNRGGAPGRCRWRARGGRSAYQSAMDRERYGVVRAGAADQPLPRRERPDAPGGAATA